MQRTRTKNIRCVEFHSVYEIGLLDFATAARFRGKKIGQTAYMTRVVSAKESIVIERMLEKNDFFRLYRNVRTVGTTRILGLF